jgi:hypothetical protein
MGGNAGDGGCCFWARKSFRIWENSLESGSGLVVISIAGDGRDCLEVAWGLPIRVGGACARRKYQHRVGTSSFKSLFEQQDISDCCCEIDVLRDLQCRGGGDQMLPNLVCKQCR